MSTATSRRADLLRAWAKDPRRFDAEALGVTDDEADRLRWDEWEAEADRGYLSVGRLALQSCRGSGKTFHYLPRRILHFAVCHPPSIVIITGPGEGVAAGVQKALIDHWFPRLVPWIRDAFKTTRTVFGQELVFAADPSLVRVITRTADTKKAEARKGAPSENSLIVVDEASALGDLAARMLTGYLSSRGLKKMIMSSQPTRGYGPFFQACTDAESGYAVVHIPGSRSHRVDPALEAELKKLGAAVYECDWQANFPSGKHESFIRQDLVLAAIGREVEVSRARPVWGLDPSGVGVDGSPLAIRRSKLLQRLIEFGGIGKEPEAVAAEIIEFWYATHEDDKPHMVNVDAGGDPGIKICKKLERAGLPVVRRFFGVPALKHQFKSARTEMWYRLRDWLPGGSLPDHPGLVEALTLPGLLSAGGGQVTLEDKQSMRTRGPSPDIGDAIALSLITDNLGEPKKEAA